MLEDNEESLPESKIKIIRLTDEYLKIFGELLTNETSRNIIMALVEKQMYVNQIADKLDMRVSLVIHHLQKLEKLGLLDIVEKPISRRTKDHRFFKIRTDVFLLFTNKDVQRIFKEGVKFASVALAGVATWFTTLSMQLKINAPLPTWFYDNLLLPSVFTGIVVSAMSILFFKKRKGKMSNQSSTDQSS